MFTFHAQTQNETKRALGSMPIEEICQSSRVVHLHIQIIGPRGEHSRIQRRSSGQLQEATKSCDAPAVAIGNSSDMVGSCQRIEVSPLALRWQQDQGAISVLSLWMIFSRQMHHNTGPT